MHNFTQFIAGSALVAIATLESATFPRPHPLPIEIQRWSEDRRLGKELDRLCGTNALYCLPPMTFPDCVTWPRVEPYDHLRPWMHSAKASFSFGQATNQLSAFDAETARQIIAAMIRSETL